MHERFPMPIRHVLSTAASIEIGFKVAMAKRPTVEAKPYRKTFSVLRDVGE
jgi:hypothetical protein